MYTHTHTHTRARARARARETLMLIYLKIYSRLVTRNNFAKVTKNLAKYRS